MLLSCVGGVGEGRGGGGLRLGILLIGWCAGEGGGNEYGYNHGGNVGVPVC